jgi:chromate transporter
VLELFLYFAMLSLVAVGGFSAIMPEVQRIVVESRAWVSANEFTQLFAISQAAPGPNVLFASLIGWKLSGLAGALVALAGICAPTALLAWWIGALWERFRGARWRMVAQSALAPVSVGFVIAGGYVLATPEGLGWRNALVAGTSAATLYATRINPLWILGAGGLAGWLLFR